MVKIMRQMDGDLSPLALAMAYQLKTALGWVIGEDESSPSISIAQLSLFEKAVRQPNNGVQPTTDTPENS
jgi:hypothetical protein